MMGHAREPYPWPVLFAQSRAGKLDQPVQAKSLQADARAHDVEELRELERHLRAAVRKVCPPSMAAHADDIVQQAMLRVMRVQAQREGGEPLGASYLRKVAYATTVDQIRRVNSQTQARENFAQASAKSSDLSPEDAAAGREIGVALRECLANLLEARRRAVVLHLQGHSVPETGELLGWTRKQAENRVYRGLANLRECLRRKGIER